MVLGWPETKITIDDEIPIVLSLLLGRRLLFLSAAFIGGAVAMVVICPWLHT